MTTRNNVDIRCFWLCYVGLHWLHWQVLAWGTVAGKRSPSQTPPEQCAEAGHTQAPSSSMFDFVRAKAKKLNGGIPLLLPLLLLHQHRLMFLHLHLIRHDVTTFHNGMCLAQ